MPHKFNDSIAKKLNIRSEQVDNTIALIKKQCTVPFIARYRKEMTNGLDEMTIAAVKNLLEKEEELEKRKRSILSSLEKRQMLSSELRKKILNAPTMQGLEDIYLPFRQKRETKASIAKGKGLEPLAEEIFVQRGIDPDTKARQFVQPDRGVTSTDEALQGAMSIIAEWISENSTARARMRSLYSKKAYITVNLVAEEKDPQGKYRSFYNLSQSCSTCPPHRVLALLRAEREKALSIKIAPAEEKATELLERLFLKGRGEDSRIVRSAINDGYKRLMAPAMERELRKKIKENADTSSIRTFTKNLHDILMEAPLGQKRILALDPGFRTGCKLVCLDEKGDLKHNETIYPNPPWNQIEQSATRIQSLVEKYSIEAIAVGNGTAGKETERFLEELNLKGVIITMVNERGASVYSASELARVEFPDRDITVRGAISIGRRLMDPLSELVKIDPKALGVGQYQHDVNQKELKKSLDETIFYCVNRVGVNLNTASSSLLSYVSGLDFGKAENIVRYRKGKGEFRYRTELLNVPGIGQTTFQQAAGFLRISGSSEILDNTGVHPEQYCVVRKIARDKGIKIKDLLKNTEVLGGIDLERYADNNTGLMTLSDIIKELKEPGRDPREEFDHLVFKNNLNSIDELEKGMLLSGIVTNVTDFGAFIDIGVHRNGLVHISRMSSSFVNHPNDILATGQRVTVRIDEVDPERSRISLSLKNVPERKN